ncbi:hypothetical protein Y032_0045g1157 [Ancylostoma ceylanicum]|uniref:SCP domain-containing protein n=1 Tax=Ancylostoma ceylanicum TaxID=53326 RepID=A0A016UC72_9BILA|nr:hypothetical protein Y032_0045g1157 [Ancylostoma ceylanicum]
MRALTQHMRRRWRRAAAPRAVQHETLKENFISESARLPESSWRGDITNEASLLSARPGCYPKPLNFNDFKKAMDVWWNQAGGYKDNYFKDRTREEFAQMMNADATEVGCAYEKKGRLTSILCLYNKRVILAEPFYQVAEEGNN